MKIWRRNIRQELEGSVQRFGRPDNRDRQDDPAPLGTGQPAHETRDDNRHGRGGMNPSVVLAAHHPKDAADSVPKAADAPRKLKWAISWGSLNRSIFHATIGQRLDSN
jgi:hypothetical protein